MPDESLLAAYENLFHDVKTPLALLYSCLQQAEKNIDMRRLAAEYIQEAQKNWFMIVKLINDTNDHAKMNRGMLVPRLKNCDITHIMKDIVEGTKTLADRKNIKLFFESAISHKTMAVDKAMIERIMLNLLSNAIKFTGECGVIWVLLTDEGSFINLTVCDNGPGIPPDMMDSIVERYIRNESNTNKYGNGIGLNIVKELTELLGGELRLESTGQGTSVTVRLPEFVTEQSHDEMLIDDFYSDKIIQIELSEHFM